MASQSNSVAEVQRSPLPRDSGLSRKVPGTKLRSIAWHEERREPGFTVPAGRRYQTLTVELNVNGGRRFKVCRVDCINLAACVAFRRALLQALKELT